jgi:hypothetical protein
MKSAINKTPIGERRGRTRRNVQVKSDSGASPNNLRPTFIGILLKLISSYFCVCFFISMEIECVLGFRRK